MARLRLGISRYASVTDAIERRLAVGGRVSCHIGHGRLYVVLRGIGATRWEPATQLARALDIVAITREVLSSDVRASVRGRAGHAVVVRFEDVEVARGCEVHAQWECVVPSPR